ncbi:MAG: phosphatase PAP2 family protein [Gemmatimonadota bacterium]|nr:phosphatase PAP2 family protein [Gemmatimonadota bacterium]
MKPIMRSIALPEVRAAPTRRSDRPGSRQVVAALAALILSGGAAGRSALEAQSGTLADSVAAYSSAPRVPLVAREDALLGALFLGSLASIEIEGIDELDALLTPTPEQSGSTYRSFGRNLGRVEVAVGLSAGTLLLGEAIGSETTARVGLRSLESLVLTAGLTTVLKVGFGRSRPDTGFEEDQFDPIAFEHSKWSFPSGHTSTVFALATTVSLELGDDAPWVPFVAYPIAAWTGVSRVLDKKHWLTDVVAGAAVGIFSARVIHRAHQDPIAEYREPAGVSPRLLVTSAGRDLMVGVSLVH